MSSMPDWFALSAVLARKASGTSGAAEIWKAETPDMDVPPRICVMKLVAGRVVRVWVVPSVVPAELVATIL